MAGGLVGNSTQIALVRRLIRKAASNRFPVLLLGETGTGKEVVARAIHDANPHGQFVTIDCVGLVPTLMESELFGHVKGSFTGAAETKQGLLDLAAGGTAFFDEIGDLPLDVQVKLLRVTQEQEFRPVGALQVKKRDLRVIAATNRNLKTEVAAGRFRQDLYYRLNVFTIHLPPLREHREDIPLLIDYFLDVAGRAGSGLRFEPSPKILDTLVSYDWPGNVRELKNCVERMVAMQSEGAIQMADLPSALVNHAMLSEVKHFPDLVNSEPDTEFRRDGGLTAPPIWELERRAIMKALADTGGQRGKAASMLGIGRTTLYRKMKEYDIG